LDAAVQIEARVVAELRERNEEAFADFVVRHAGAMRRVAAAITRCSAMAEDVVQETWLAVLTGIDRFEARSSLRTWVFRILVNRARSLARREARSIPWSALAGDGTEELPAERFQHPGATGHWTVPVADWGRSPETDLLSGELLGVIHDAVARLSPTQRAVITMRDIEGWPADEVSNILGISAVHQRVLLHRARTAVRASLETYYSKA
jgi:RNA polymerase sigma-70 factor (ECF subfamily)